MMCVRDSNRFKYQLFFFFFLGRVGTETEGREREVLERFGMHRKLVFRLFLSFSAHRHVPYPLARFLFHPHNLATQSSPRGPPIKASFPLKLPPLKMYLLLLPHLPHPPQKSLSPCLNIRKALCLNSLISSVNDRLPTSGTPPDECLIGTRWALWRK